MDDANDKAERIASEVSERVLHMRQEAFDLLHGAGLWNEQGEAASPGLKRLGERWFDLLEAMEEVLYTADNLRLQAQDNNRQERA